MFSWWCSLLHTVCEVINKLSWCGAKCPPSSWQRLAGVGASALACSWLWGVDQMRHLYICILCWKAVPTKCEIWKVFGSRHKGLRVWGWMPAKHVRKRAPWESLVTGKKACLFFWRLIQISVHNLPSSPSCFLFQVKNQNRFLHLVLPVLVKAQMCCVLLPEIQSYLPERTGRTSEDINWQQNNPLRIFQTWILMMRKKSYSKCFFFWDIKKPLKRVHKKKKKIYQPCAK